ncbi:MAG: methyltransferase domain-containing protein [Lautropia sp.]
MNKAIRFTARLLAPWHLDDPLIGALRHARDAASRSYWHVRRGLGRVDRRRIDAHLGGPGPVRLHLGCGEHLLQGWLNADFFPTAPDVIHIDATRRFPLPDASVDRIFSEHMIEHLSYVDGLTMLAECRRVLKPGGRIRVSTPDLLALLDLCRKDRSALQQQFLDWSTERFIDWAPYAGEAIFLNHFVRSWGHQFVYDEATLRDSMRRCGFAEITAHAINLSDDPLLRDLENEARMPAGLLALHSMTLEAVRPAAG